MSLVPHSGPMTTQADALGFYTTPLGGYKIPRFQFGTVAQLLTGEPFQVPSSALLFGVSQAPKAALEAGQEQMALE